MKSYFLYTILTLCGFAVIPSFEMGLVVPNEYGANITITNVNDEILNVKILHIDDDGMPRQGQIGKFWVDVKRATVESRETVRCFFTTRGLRRVATEVGESLLSPFFSPAEEFTELYEEAGHLYCYDSSVYTNTPVREGGTAVNSNNTVAATGSTRTAAIFTIYFPSPPPYYKEPYVQVIVPKGQIHGSVNLFSGVRRLSYVEHAEIVDASSDQKTALESVSAVTDDDLPPSREDSSVHKDAVCYIELHPSGIRPLSLDEVVVFDRPEIMRGVTCFRAGHTEEDFERVRSTQRRWVE